MLYYLLVGVRVHPRYATDTQRTQWTRLHLRRFNVGLRLGRATAYRLASLLGLRWLIVLVQRRLDVVHERQNFAQQRGLVDRNRSVHLLDLPNRIGINLGRNSFTASHVLSDGKGTN